MPIDQISIFIENKPGKMAQATELIANAGVDLRALSLADTTDFGILRVIVDKPKRALDVLREHGYLVKETKVIPVSVSDTPGGMAAVLRVLADASLDVDYLYAFVAHGDNRAYVIIHVEDTDAAVGILNEKKISLVSAEEMYGI